MIKNLGILVSGLIILGLTSACAVTHTPTQSSRNAIEQLLISEAVVRSLPKHLEVPLPIPPGANVTVDTTGISAVIIDVAEASADQHFVHQVVAGWLGQQGYRVDSDEEKAAYKISVIVESLGTELGDSLFGMPAVQGSILPIALPELAIYKAIFQTGYAKLYLNIFELPTGRFIGSTSSFIAETYFNDYTLLFLFSFNKTDLVSPPQLGTFRDPIKTQTKKDASSRTQQ